ncbi:MAG: glycosyltransferase 87 family protein [Kocuria sp.]|nr:glycosyltransferase 87 family protein [Kocuria sp.]
MSTPTSARQSASTPPWVPWGVTRRFWVWSLVGFAVWTLGASWFVRLACHQMSWDGGVAFHATCYSDLPTLYRNTGMVDGNFPYMSPDALLEYPVLQTVIASITGVVAHAISGDTSVHNAQSIYFDVNFVLLTVVWITTVLLLARMVAAPRFAVVAALAPAAAATATINWDLWPVLASVAALWFFRKEQWVWGGIMLGIGTALKLWPFVMLGAVIVIGIRQRHLIPAVKATVAAVVTWLAINMPFYLLDPQQWKYFWGFSSERGAGYSSIYHVWNVVVVPALSGEPLSPDVINLIAYGGFALCCLVILGLGFLAPKPPTLEQLSLLIVAAFVVTNKVYSPQFVLWLVPLVILARPKIGQFLIWQVVEVFHWFVIFRWLHVMIREPGLQQFWTSVYGVAVFLHVLAVVLICTATVIDIMRGRAPSNVTDSAVTVNQAHFPRGAQKEAVASA